MKVRELLQEIENQRRQYTATNIAFDDLDLQVMGHINIDGKRYEIKTPWADISFTITAGIDEVLEIRPTNDDLEINDKQDI